MQSLEDRCQELENHRSKLQHDLGARDQLVGTLQGQLDSKSRMYDNAMTKLKNRADLDESAPGQMIAPPTPIKASHPSRQSFSVTPHKQESFVPNNDESLEKLKADYERKLVHKDEEIRDLQTKLFEKTSVSNILVI